jgi:hypothetical protein
MMDAWPAGRDPRSAALPNFFQFASLIALTYSFLLMAGVAWHCAMCPVRLCGYRLSKTEIVEVIQT